MEDLIQELENYLIENNISYKKFEKSNDFVVQIDGKKYQLFEPMRLKVAGIETSKLFFDERFRWCLDVTDYDGYIIKFGGVWYTFNRGEELDPKLRRVKWIGETSLQGCEDYPYYLGVHGPFELLNGTGNYKDWAKKAKFLKIQKLGICERGSLSGAFKFQSACKKEGIAPIFGIEVPIKNEEKDITYSIKVFAKNENGWQNLLRIDKLLNVDKNGFVSEQDIEENKEDTFLILDPKSQAFETVYRKWNVKSDEIYFQLDSVVYNKEERDKEYLLNLQKFYRSKIKPIAFCDAYYIEKEYKPLKDLLNRVAGKVSYDSDNQYFKNYSEYLGEIYSICKDEDQFDVLLEEALGNLFYVAENCNFEIETKNRHLPKYIMTEEESQTWPSNRAMFEDLVFQGLEDHKELLNRYSIDVLSERIEKEIDVIEYGGVEDYFLILRDIINWSKNQNILLGAGRGSAAGSLVAYLLGITKVNPLKYNLLFERFLNKGRVTVSLPDIDSDFSSESRPYVKKYMEQRFGETQVCAVGTYTTYQLKAALTDFAKLYGVSIPTVRRLSKMINGLDDKTPEDFFRIACKSVEMKIFVNKHPELINMMFLVLGQPKAASIHACAMMIFPQEKTMFQWTPIRKQNDIMVSEWEGGELDEAGFLKEDILGIEQLSKFADILNLIKQNEGKQIDLYKDVSLDDSEVFEAFCNGFTQDLFHFGAKGLSRYVVKVQPRNINDLIACICLYRPGPMENGYHEKFLLRREGSERIEYPIGAEDILKDSFGLMTTQEHIMLMCQKLAGFSLQHADDVRKAMGKKIMDKLKAIRSEFVEGYVERYKDQGVDEEYANSLWSQMEEFGKYAFNRSHAAAYSINGYNSMWLKVHYPVEFWSVAFSRASKDEYPFYINEIIRSNNIQLKSVNINKSDVNIVVDPDDGALYWAINSVYQVGEKAQQQISEERKKNGPYFSLDEFIDRHVFKGSAVNKSVIENLIMCGAFDDLSEGPTIVEKREGLLRKYREQYSIKINEEKDEFEKAIRARSGDKSKEEWWWQLQQKKRSGFSFFNYKSLCRRYFDNLNLKNRSFCDLARNIDDFKDSYQVAVLGGYVLECEIKDSRKGRFARVLLESNYSIIKVIVYAEIFPDFEELLQDCEKTILLLDGKILYSEYDEDYVVQTVKSTKIVKLTLD